MKKTAIALVLAVGAFAGAPNATAEEVQMKTLTPGRGPSPTAEQSVTVHYRGTLADGTEFDSSYKRNQPARFALKGVIPCWTAALQEMQVGETAQLVCPPDTAYGVRGIRGLIPPNSTLMFEVTLLSIE